MQHGQEAIAGDHDKNHEQALALNERQLSHVPAIMEQQIIRPHCNDIICGGARMQSVKSLVRSSVAWGAKARTEGEEYCRARCDRESEASGWSVQFALTLTSPRSRTTSPLASFCFQADENAYVRVWPRDGSDRHILNLSKTDRRCGVVGAGDAVCVPELARRFCRHQHSGERNVLDANVGLMYLGRRY